MLSLLRVGKEGNHVTPRKALFENAENSYRGELHWNATAGCMKPQVLVSTKLAHEHVPEAMQGRIAPRAWSATTLRRQQARRKVAIVFVTQGSVPTPCKI